MKTVGLVFLPCAALCLAAPLPALAQAAPAPTPGSAPKDSLFAQKAGRPQAPGGNGTLYYIPPPTVAAQAQSAQHTPAMPAAPVHKRPFFTGAFSGAFDGGTLYLGPHPSPQVETGNQQLYDSIKRGEAVLKSGDTDGAIAAFQDALASDPRDGLARQRLAEAYTAKGQTDRAIATYRALLSPVPGQRWGNSNVNSPTVLTHFALLLLQTGQGPEALTAYQRAAGLLNHEDGKAHRLESDLPALGDGPGQEPYTPQRLLAMTHLAAGIDTFAHIGPADPEPLAHFREAVRLAPDSAAAYFYLGKCLYAKGRMNRQEAKAMLERAVQLGDERTAQAAQVYLKVLR